MEGEVPLPRSVSTHYRKDSNICDSLIYLDNKTRSFTLEMFVCMYAFTCHRQKIVTDSSFSNPPINKTK